MADAAINIDMIVQNVSTRGTGRTDVSFTLPRAEGPVAIEALQRIQDAVGFEELTYDDHVGKLSLIGAAMKSNPGVSARLFGALVRRRHQHRDDLDVGDPHLGCVP